MSLEPLLSHFAFSLFSLGYLFPLRSVALLPAFICPFRILADAFSIIVKFSCSIVPPFPFSFFVSSVFFLGVGPLVETAFFFIGFALENFSRGPR